MLHSGLASLRPRIASVIGERLYRIIFALSSIPAAVGVIIYFIAHRYDGALLSPLLQDVPGVHSAVWVMTLISFLFLYPATFNLMEVAAISKPGFRIYERGIIRITRHPQLFGQILWCFAHCVWIGSSFMLVTSCGLVAHHLFGAWNGDRRLRNSFGQEWIEYAQRTSIVPFAALISGEQKLAWKEFFTPAYVGVVATTLAFYAAHPVVLKAVGGLRW